MVLQSVKYRTFSIVFLRHKPLTSPGNADVAFLVEGTDEQALDDRHRDVELLEDVRLLLNFARFDELVEPLLRQHKRHQILLYGVEVTHEMDVGPFLRVEPDKPEVELLHFRDVPLQRFEDHLVAGGDVGRRFEALLGANQNAVYRALELLDYLLAPLEGYIAANYEHLTVGKFGFHMPPVHFERFERRTTDSHLARHTSQHIDLPDLRRAHRVSEERGTDPHKIV